MGLLFVTNLTQKTVGLSRQFLRLFILFIPALVLSACATPAHHNNSWLPNIDTKTVQVRVYGIDAYEMDGFILDSEGLEQQIIALKKIISIDKLLIEPKANAALFEQAVALYIGEKHGLKTYRASYFNSDKISSAEILSEIDNPESFLDIFSF